YIKHVITRLLSVYIILYHFHHFLFFFYCYGAHRDLHSFPTRRSSDLDVFAAVLALRPGSFRAAVQLGLANEGLGDQNELHGGSRSEEHTSELQSRGHLVCRLLLEKKKKTVATAKRNATVCAIITGSCG